MRCYIRQEKREYEDCGEKGAHQRWICDPDVTPNLFAIALFDNDIKQRPFVLLLERVSVTFSTSFITSSLVTFLASVILGTGCDFYDTLLIYNNQAEVCAWMYV